MKISNEAKSIFKKLWNLFTTTLVVLAIFLAVAFVGVRLLGFQVYAVLSGSMEPDLPVGSLVYVKATEPEKLEIGDDISFLIAEKTIVTHRIIDIIPDENDPTVLRFQTQGIANDVADGNLVHYKNVIGKVAFHIPLLGYVSNFIQSNLGRYIILIGGTFLILATFLPDILAPIWKKETEEVPSSTAEDSSDTQNPPNPEA